MNSRSRPLSPHLQVYRLQLTSMMSILHRGTGIILFFGTLMIVVWLVILAFSPYAFDVYHKFLGSISGRLLLLGWTFSLFYHLANGIRHMLLDIGWGFEIQKVYLTGWIVVVSSCVLTGVMWLMLLLF